MYSCAAKVLAVPKRAIPAHFARHVKLAFVLHVASDPLVVSQLPKVALGAQRLHIFTDTRPAHDERQLVVDVEVGRELLRAPKALHPLMLGHRQSVILARTTYHADALTNGKLTHVVSSALSLGV